MFYRHLKGPIEALLFASGQQLPADQIAGILNIAPDHVHNLIAEMIDSMTDDERGLTIVAVAGGYQLCTKPALADIAGRLAATSETKLSIAAMETLAIIAFKQPVTRQEIENIRGVKVDKVISTLLERTLIKEVGRKEAVGRPILYATTNIFLQCFGLKSLNELPPIANLLPENVAE